MRKRWIAYIVVCFFYLSLFPVARAAYLDQLVGNVTGDNTSIISGIADIQTRGPWADVRAYGAVGDNTTDDTAAIQAAIDAAEVTGGTVYFPKGKYLISSTLTVASSYPVVLRGEMYQPPAPSSTYGSILTPKAGGTFTNGMIVFDTAANAGSYGGGAVIGLAFVDSPARTTAIGKGALNLTDFHGGTVRDVFFDGILGTAIYMDNCVKVVVDGFEILNSGNTGASAMVVGTNNAGTGGVQSTSIMNGRMETNYSAPYIFIDGRGDSEENKFSNIGFEATAAIAATNQEFIHDNALRCQFSNIHMNHNDGRKIWIDTGGSWSQWANIIMNNGLAGALAEDALFIDSNYNEFTNLTIIGGLTGNEIAIDNDAMGNQFSNFDFYNTGCIDVWGPRTKFVNGFIRKPTCQSAYMMTFQDGSAESTVSSVTFLGSDLAADGRTNRGGVNVLDNYVLLSGNQFSNFIDNTMAISANEWGIIIGNVIGTDNAGAYIANPIQGIRANAVTFAYGNVDEGSYVTGLWNIGKRYFSRATAPDNTVACGVGDIAWNTGADNVLGWKCTVGTPTNTWKAMTITLAP